MSVTSIEEEVVFFAFESDFVASLRCIPMAVRFKLDLCGVKLWLKAWSRFDHATRSECAHRNTRNPNEVRVYREFVLQAIERSGLLPVLLAVDPAPDWLARDKPPSAVLEKAAALGLYSTRFESWGELSDLQRFALLKLSRKGHENENFEPAMREFGLS